MTIDSQAEGIPRCRIALNSISRVRQEMCRVYRASRSGEVQLGDMTKLIFALGQIGRMVELETFETRLLALEALPDSKPARLPMPEDMS